MNHTPTPFEVKYIGSNVYIEPQGRKGFIADLQYTDCQSEEEMGEALANAAFIVLACNAHEELIAMVKEFIQDYQEMGMGDKRAACNAQQLLTTIEKGS